MVERLSEKQEVADSSSALGTPGAGGGPQGSLPAPSTTPASGGMADAQA